MGMGSPRTELVEEKGCSLQMLRRKYNVEILRQSTVL